MSPSMTAYVELPTDVASLFRHAEYETDNDNVAESYIFLNFNCNANIPGNGNPEFGPNEGCGCTFSYNGGARGGTAVCCDGCKPYEEGFNDKKSDSICCCESSRCYDRAGPAKTCGAKSCGPSADFYVPDYLPTSQPRKGCESDGSAYQGGLCNKKPDGCCCSPEYKYVVENPPLQIYCEKGDKRCCGALSRTGPDTYESICNTDAQRYKGCGPDRKNFYSNDNDCGCQFSNNACCGGTDWSEVRRQSYASVECTRSGAPLPLIKQHPSFCVEVENYACCKTMSNNIVSAILPIQLTGGESSTDAEPAEAVALKDEGTGV